MWNLYNSIDRTCIMCIILLWLIPHPIVIWLTYGSMECNKGRCVHVQACARAYICVCVCVCMYTETFKISTPKCYINTPLQRGKFLSTKTGYNQEYIPHASVRIQYQWVQLLLKRVCTLNCAHTHPSHCQHIHQQPTHCRKEQAW
jgi:hypothetical protein